MVVAVYSGLQGGQDFFRGRIRRYPDEASRKLPISRTYPLAKL